MINFINLVFYSVLLYLLEAGYIKRFFNYIKINYIIKKSKITFSNIEVSEEFIANNNYLEEGNIPLLANTDNNNNDNIININKNENQNNN